MLLYIIILHRWKFHIRRSCQSSLIIIRIDKLYLRVFVNKWICYLWVLINNKFYSMKFLWIHLGINNCWKALVFNLLILFWIIIYYRCFRWCWDTLIYIGRINIISINKWLWSLNRMHIIIVKTKWRRNYVCIILCINVTLLLFIKRRLWILVSKFLFYQWFLLAFTICCLYIFLIVYIFIEYIIKTIFYTCFRYLLMINSQKSLFLWWNNFRIMNI